MDLSCIIASGDLELFVLGQLPPDEAEKVEILRRTFPEIAEEIRRIEQTFENLAQENAVTPSPALKKRLFQQLPEQESGARVVSLPARRQRNPLIWQITAAACLLIALAAAWYMNREMQSLRQTTAEMRDTLQSREKALLAAREMQDFLSGPGLQRVALNPVAQGGGPSIMVYWDRSSQKVYIDAGLLPAPPPGMQYQLWSLKNGRPVDAGMLAREGRTGMQRMKDCVSADAFAITLEKEGGSPTPNLNELKVMGKITG